MLNRLILLMFLVVGLTLKIFADDSLRYEINVEKSLLGTEITGKVICADLLKAKKALYYAFKEIERIDSCYDYSSENSKIHKINNNAYKSPVNVDIETFELLRRSIKYSELYFGLFDISLGALTDLWGFSKDAEIKLPHPDSINKLLESVGYENIILDSVKMTCKFNKPDLKIDLGGIAKGYAVDRAASILDSLGIDDYIINAGGDLTAKGKNKNGENWNVGIKHPRIADTIISAFKSPYAKTSIASSGDYERYKIINGKRYHHILNPFTGYCENKCQSVTVIYDNTEATTALAKYIFLIGSDEFLNLELSKKIKYLIVDDKGKVITNM